MVVNGIILADMHWGAIPPEDFYQELRNDLLKYIDEMDSLDFIVIAGDLFDTKETLSSLTVRYAIMFLTEIMYLAEYNQNYYPELKLVEGTRTHDNLQLSNLGMMLGYTFNNECQGDLVTVYEHVSDGYLGEMKVLYIPEEYVVDQDEYYKKWFEEDYDIIIGHGMIDKVWFGKKADGELTKHMSAPVFKVDQLLDHCQNCYFGHIHTKKEYGDKGRFKYVGPYTRWEFGNDTEAGFYHVVFDPDTKKVTDNYILNSKAKNYPTVPFSITEDVSLTNLNAKIDEIISNVYSQIDNVGRIRIIVNLKSSLETANSMKDFLISKLGDMSNIKFVLNMMDSEEDIPVTEEDLEKQREERSYVFDHSIDVPERIQQFIRKKVGRDIPLDKIKKYLEGE